MLSRWNNETTVEMKGSVAPLSVFLRLQERFSSKCHDTKRMFSRHVLVLFSCLLINILLLKVFVVIPFCVEALVALLVFDQLLLPFTVK